MTVLLAVAGCRFASATSSLQQVFVLGHVRVRRLVDDRLAAKNAGWRARRMARKTGPIKISPGPTLAARMPSMAVRACAGATEEIPSMVPPKGSTTLLFRPLSAISSTPFRVGIVSNDEDQPSNP